ncbi:MAG: hemolysin family protein [Deltaproteobacteria bacterium]
MGTLLSMYAIVIITAISLIGSFLCSLMEAAIYSIPRSRIESLRREGDINGIRLVRLRNRIDEPIAAILTLNTAVNVIGASVAGSLVARIYGDAWLGIFSGAFTGAVLIFSEIIPKSLGVTYANQLAPRLSFLIELLIKGLWPFVKMSYFITSLWGKNSHLNYPTEEDIRSLAELSHHGGEILPVEAEIVANALRLDEIKVRDIMTPKSVVYSMPESAKLKEIELESDYWHFSRIPVHADNDPDNIVGVALRRDVLMTMLKSERERDLHSIMISPDFVGEDMLLDELLNRFIISRRHLFCVKNEKGEFTGVVALEDIIESLIGEEIVDELDIHEDMQAHAKRKVKNITEQ